VISRVTGPEAARRPAPPPPTRLDLAECYRYCEAIVRSHHENFPVASRFLPERLRPHVSALYAFVRAADDFADEPQYDGRREAELDRWEDRLVRCFHREADHPVFVALAATVAKLDLPIAPFSELLQAFRLDLTTRRYPGYGDLYTYTQRAAQPIGRLLLYAFGVRDSESHRFADDLATALALTAFWQDIARDLARDRIYLPQEDMRHFGVTEADLRAQRESHALADLVRFECSRARSYYLRARPLLDRVEAELLTEMALFWFGGARMLEKIEAAADRVFAGRPHLGTIDKTFVLGKALARRGGLRVP
jgi:squalene synthase HpnC